MGLLDRIGGKVKAGLNAALAPAADPRQTYVNAYQKQRQLLAQVGQALDQVLASKRRLHEKTAEVRDKLPALEDQARAALRRGRVDLARVALQRRQAAVLELQTLEQQVGEIEKEESSLSVIEQRLGTQVEAFAARQEVVMARYSAAEAQVRINEAVTGVSQEFADLAAALARTEQKAEDMQARATAIDRLVQDGILEPGLSARTPDAIDSRLSAAGAELDVEEQLAALAEEVGRRLPAS